MRYLASLEKGDLPSRSSVELLCEFNRLRSGVDSGVLRREYSRFSLEATLLLAVSSDTWRIVGSV